MNRLTKDLHTPHDDTTYAEVVKDAIDRENIVLTKLKHYEDIEEELGCPLEVVFKALKDKQVIFKHIYGLKKPKIYLETHKIAGLLFDGKNYDLWLYDNGYGDEFCAYTKDYGKTWALTKEELEGEV